MNSNLPALKPDILEHLKAFCLPGGVSIKGAKAYRTGALSDVYLSRYKRPVADAAATTTDGTISTSTTDEAENVVIKLLRFSQNEEVKDIFEKEIYVWSKLKHPNILPLVGYTFHEETGYPMLVSEWMRGDTVMDYVKKKPNCDLKQLVLGIAKGLEYLHSEKVTHSDIKPANIVVYVTSDKSAEAQICDFGCARILDATRSIAKPSAGEKGTVSYSAPELFKLLDPSSSPYTKMTDVWAFGMTVYALLTKESPYKRWRTDINIARAIIAGELPPMPDPETLTPDHSELREICLLCMEHNPETRIKMSSIVARLSGKSGQQ